MERKLAAILSADVQGYSRLMGDDEEATIRTLTAYREVMTSLIQQHRGRVVDSPGDNLLAEFASAVDAVQGAVAIQQELKTRNAELPAHRQMHYRIGINVGDVVVEGERIYGDGVNIAARIESLAEGGGISISSTVYDHIANKLDFSYEFQGEQTVKNIAQPVRVYRVLLEAEKAALTLSLEQPAELPLPDKPSIAVLPFTNMSADPEQEYFSDGITDTLITDLSKIASLFVIARNSTFTYKGQAVEVGEVGRKLGVQYVVEGSIQKAGRRVRINVQLIDAPTGGHVWAERYDRELGDIFDLQDEITRKIVFALKVTLTPDEQERFRQAPTDNLDAYDCYLRGVDWYHRYAKEPTAQARQLFEQALALDPQYAGAHAFLGHIHTIEFGFQWSADRASSLNQAAAYAHKAVTLDTSLPLAHRVLGFVSLWQKQYDRAVAESERAITLDPNYADGYIYLASILSFVGRAEEAIERAEQAMRLNPYYPANYETHLGVSYYMAQRNAEALRTLQNACLRAPDGLAAHIFLASLYGELGRVAEARAEVAEIVRLSPTFTLESFQQDLPVRASTDLERILAALHKAGLE